MAAASQNQLMTMEALYAEIGPAYEAAFEGLSPQIASIEWLKAEFNDRIPAKILDIGCGTGKPVCFELANAGHNVTGIDISGTMIAAARAQVPNAHFIKVDVGQYDAGPAEFDAITAYFSMLGCVSQNDIREYMQKIYDWLKPAGVFVFATVPQEGNNQEVKWMGRRLTMSSFHPPGIIQLLKNTGFEILHHDITQFTPKSVEAGICNSEDASDETHMFVYARKR